MDSGDEQAAALFLFTCAEYLQIKRKAAKKRSRRYKVRSLNRVRLQQGHYANGITHVRHLDREQFYKYTHMSVALYDHLLELMLPYLQKTVSKNPLSPGERLSITLHYLSEGCSMQQLALDNYLEKTTIHVVLEETCALLWKVLMPIYMKTPTKEDLLRVADGFYKRWNMPNCIGALDGKHIAIQAPKYFGTKYSNYKKHYSIMLMAVCDSYYRFTMVDIGGAGSNHNSAIFKNTGFGTAIMDEELNDINMPRAKPLPGSEALLPYFLVADQAFPLHTRIMRPYRGDHLDNRKRIFNYRISRARRCIENTFGIFYQRWRIFRKPIIANVENCELVTKAAVVLHNYIQSSEMDLPPSERQYCPTGFADFVDDKGIFHHGHWREGRSLTSIGRVGVNNSSRILREYREHLANYFISPFGSVPWQESLNEKGSMPTNC